MESQVVPVRPWAKANGISVNTVYRLVAEKKLSLVKIRSRTYITRAEAERWLASLSAASPAQSA